MTPAPSRCPLDASELVFLGGRWAWRGERDVSYAYCPRCDAAFLFREGPAGGEPDTFTWRRVGGELRLIDEDWARLPNDLGPSWKAVRSALLQGVGAFLGGRFAREQCRPSDGTRTPLVGEAPYDERSPARFYWCKWCQEVFAYLRDPDYGWRVVAAFAYDRPARCYVLRGSSPPGLDLERLGKAVASLAALPGPETET
jgi:hypothetical protein